MLVSYVFILVSAFSLSVPIDVLSYEKSLSELVLCIVSFYQSDLE